MKELKVLNSKKGLTPNVWVTVALGIAFGVIMIAVVAIVLSALASGTTDGNATAIIANGQTFLLNLTSQLGTVGTVAGVLLLVGLLVASGIGGYMMYERSQR